jgi:putative tryptophan/tyrosine transport system substrate-binding protein
MKRREFVTLLGGAAAAWPLAAHAQQAVMPVIGFLRTISAAPSQHLVAAFRQGLKKVGFVEGQGVAVRIPLPPCGIKHAASFPRGMPACVVK